MTLPKPSTNTPCLRIFFQRTVNFSQWLFYKFIGWNFVCKWREFLVKKTITTYLTWFYTSWEITGSVTYLFPNQDVGFKEKECWEEKLGLGMVNIKLKNRIFGVIYDFLILAFSISLVQIKTKTDWQARCLKDLEAENVIYNTSEINKTISDKYIWTL